MGTLSDKRFEVLAGLAKQLATTLDGNPDFPVAKKAIMDFIAATDETAHVLGDGDIMGMAVRSCKFRHKDEAGMYSLLRMKAGA